MPLWNVTEIRQIEAETPEEAVARAHDGQMVSVNIMRVDGPGARPVGNPFIGDYVAPEAGTVPAETITPEPAPVLDESPTFFDPGAQTAPTTKET